MRSRTTAAAWLLAAGSRVCQMPVRKQQSQRCCKYGVLKIGDKNRHLISTLQSAKLLCTKLRSRSHFQDRVRLQLTLTSCCHSDGCSGCMSSSRTRPRAAAAVGIWGGPADLCCCKALLASAELANAFSAGTLHLGSGPSLGARNLCMFRTQGWLVSTEESPVAPADKQGRCPHEISYSRLCSALQMLSKASRQSPNAHLLRASFSAVTCSSFSSRLLVSVAVSACWPMGAGSSGAITPCVDWSATITQSAICCRLSVLPHLLGRPDQPADLQANMGTCLLSKAGGGSWGTCMRGSLPA